MFIISSEYIERRKKDVLRACIVQKFVDEIYKSSGMNITRVDDEYLQKKGIDFISQGINFAALFDEKFAINYWNYDLKTFSFELWTGNNRYNSGWFTDKTSITTDYALLWIRSKDEMFNEIVSAELLFIKKSAIQNYLIENGIKVDCLVDLLNQKGRFQNNHKFYIINSDIKLVQSLNIIPEKPINVLIAKKVLETLAYRKFTYPKI